MWKLCCPELLPHLATDISGHLVPTLNLLPTSHQSGTGGSWAVISPGSSRKAQQAQQGLHFAQHCLTLCLAAFPRWVPPACPALGPLSRGVGGEGRPAPPGEVARSQFYKQVAQPRAGVTDPISHWLLLCSTRKPLHQLFPGRGLCLAAVQVSQLSQKSEF